MARLLFLFSGFFPRVEHGQAQTREVFHVPRDYCESMLKSSGGQKAIDISKWGSSALRLRGKHCPAVGYGLGDRQQTRFKRFDQFVIQPLLQLDTPLAVGKKFNPPADFRKGQNAGVERVGFGCFELLFYPTVGLCSSH